MGKGIEFGKNENNLNRRIGRYPVVIDETARRKIDEAVKHLNNTIDSLIIAERKFKESGQLLDENTIRLFRIKIANIRNDIIRAVAL